MRGTLLVMLCLWVAGAGGLARADYTVKGSVDCAKVVQEDENVHYREYNKWWLLGYFSARNYMGAIANTGIATAGKDVENDKLYALALAFCRENPDADWDAAALHVYDLLD